MAKKLLQEIFLTMAMVLVKIINAYRAVGPRHMCSVGAGRSNCRFMHATLDFFSFF